MKNEGTELKKINGYSVTDSGVSEEKINEYYTDIFTPGQTKEQLEIGREVKGKISTQVFLGNSSRSTSSGTGTQNITGVGFSPSKVIIHALGGSTGSNGISDGYYNLGNFVRYSYFNAGTNVVGSFNSNCVYINSAGNESVGSITSLSNDGFSIDWSILQVNTTFWFECYK